MNDYSSPRQQEHAVRAYEHRRRRRELAKRRALPPTIDLIADRDVLYRSFESVARDGGPEPGPDGIRAADISPAHCGKALAHVARLLLARRYRPGKSRKVTVPKAGGSGTRTLRVANLIDRVVSKALHEALSGRWEKLFLDGSFGFRRRRGPWKMLAAMEANMMSDRRFVLVVDDVRNAFDNVWLARLMHHHRQLIKDVSLLNLVRICLQTEPLPEYEFGIAQGNCYSPTALNVLLHYEHDVPLEQEIGPGQWYRFADNLVYLCRSEDEAMLRRQDARRLLEGIGMTLKGNDATAVVNLAASKPADVLGFDIRLERGKLRYKLGGRAWNNLANALIDAHGKVDPAATANQVIRGWVEQTGPAFRQPEKMVDPILQFAAGLGFREFDRAEILEIGQNSHQRWLSALDRARLPSAKK